MEYLSTQYSGISNQYPSASNQHPSATKPHQIIESIKKIGEKIPNKWNASEGSQSELANKLILLPEETRNSLFNKYPNCHVDTLKGNVMQPCTPFALCQAFVTNIARSNEGIDIEKMVKYLEEISMSSVTSNNSNSNSISNDAEVIRLNGDLTRLHQNYLKLEEALKKKDQELQKLRESIPSAAVNVPMNPVLANDINELFQEISQIQRLIEFPVLKDIIPHITSLNTIATKIKNPQSSSQKPSPDMSEETFRVVLQLSALEYDKKTLTEELHSLNLVKDKIHTLLMDKLRVWNSEKDELESCNAQLHQGKLELEEQLRQKELENQKQKEEIETLKRMVNQLNESQANNSSNNSTQSNQTQWAALQHITPWTPTATQIEELAKNLALNIRSFCEGICYLGSRHYDYSKSLCDEVASMRNYVPKDIAKAIFIRIAKEKVLSKQNIVDICSKQSFGGLLFQVPEFSSTMWALHHQRNPS